MCGIGGFLCNPDTTLVPAWIPVLNNMGAKMMHRGPDDAGLYVDGSAGIGFVHRRLSVVDLTAAGGQPMMSHSGRFVLSYNGEIYNHLSLRKELEKGVPSCTDWRGSSDTETLLACIEVWGLKITLSKLVGMFAFSLWDKLDQSLTLARDRLGEKPLYYGWQNNIFLFASELKALKVHPSFNAEIDRDSVSSLMQYGYVASPASIYKGIRKLPPATTLCISYACREAKPQVYWDSTTIVGANSRAPYSGTPSDAVEELEKLLRNSIEGQMIADVPLGALLSGGIDSSIVTALMQDQSSVPINTFTIGFEQAEYNEAEYAKAIARHLGTNHTELYVTASQALDSIALLPSLYCEPFADASQIPTYLVSQLARSKVTAALSGDGGDELFCGYNRYLLASRMWHKLSALPVSIRKLAASLILNVSPPAWNSVLSPFRSVLPSEIRTGNAGDRLHKAARVLGARSSSELYQLLIRHWQRSEDLVIGANSGKVEFEDGQLDSNFIHDMMAKDMLGYLPDDILTKVDRAAMGVSLETRVPLLDHRVVEFAWKLPLEYKLRDNVGKWPLRQVLNKYVPRELIERPKMGFGVPLDSWLRGPLREWAEELLDHSRLQREGIFEPGLIRQKWEEHQSEKRNWQYQLWNVLMFQAWFENE